MTYVLTKKKQHHGHPQQSPGATYNVPAHVIRMAEEPVTIPRVNKLSGAVERGETCVNDMSNAETSKKVHEKDTRAIMAIREEGKELSKSDLKLCKLKVAGMLGTECGDRSTVICQKELVREEDTLADGLRNSDGGDNVDFGRCTGAKKRKSGSVKRFKKDSELRSVDDTPNRGSACAALIPINVQYTNFPWNSTGCKSKFEDSKNMCAITQIIKPMSYKSSTSNNAHDILVTFEALR